MGLIILHEGGVPLQKGHTDQQALVLAEPHSLEEALSQADAFDLFVADVEAPFVDLEVDYLGVVAEPLLGDEFDSLPNFVVVEPVVVVDLDLVDEDLLPGFEVLSLEELF